MGYSWEDNAEDKGIAWFVGIYDRDTLKVHCIICKEPMPSINYRDIQYHYRTNHVEEYAMIKLSGLPVANFVPKDEVEKKLTTYDVGVLDKALQYE
jgi:hypothetical protein